MGKTTEQLKKEDKDKKCRTQLAQMREMLDQADDTIVIDSDRVSTNLNQNCCKVRKLWGQLYKYISLLPLTGRPATRTSLINKWISLYKDGSW